MLSSPSSPQVDDGGSSLLGTERILGDGTMARQIRAHDWSAHALGAIADWPDTLVSSLNGILSCALPRLLYWGADGAMFYNEAAIPLIAERHPRDLGVSIRESWREAWPTLGPQFEAAITTGTPTFQQDVLVPVLRTGVLENVYWTYSYSPIFTPEGKIGGVDSIALDTTREILTERNRDEIAAQLHQVQEVTTDSVLSIDRNWNITYLNPQARRTAGPLSDAVGRNFWTNFPAAAYEGSPFLKHYYLAMDEGIPADFEAFYPAPLNIWVNVQVRPNNAGIVLFFRDITGQKKAAEELRQTLDALRESEEELRWTLQLSAQVQWTADPKGNVTGFSDRWLELTGLDRERALGEGWMGVVYEEDLQRMAEVWTRAMTTGEPYDVEHRILTASGEILWMRSRAFPRRDEQGNILKWYGTTENIETRKKAEEVLRTTEKLTVVGRLAASIAHEINNPLESVTNLLYLARASKDLPEIQEYLATAERELRRVSAISSQTLRFHKQSTDPTAVFCYELFEGVLSIFQGRLLNSRIHVESRKRAEKSINCFEGEIRQVLSNLVGNAIDAMHPGGGRLLVRSRETCHWRTAQKGIMLTVADTGTGMSPHTVAKVFEAFYTTKGMGGTGLGLWVSKEIVDRHKGSLRVRSSQKPGGSGTVFTLFLPYNAVSRA